MRTLVTGARGFAGRHLMRELGDDAVAGAADVTDARPCGTRSPPAARRRRAPRGALVRGRVAARSSGVARQRARHGARPRGGAPRAAGARVLVGLHRRGLRRRRPDRATEDRARAGLAVRRVEGGRRDRLRAGRPREPARHRRRPPVPARGPGQDERFAVGSWTRQIARLERDGGGALHVGDLGRRARPHRRPRRRPRLPPAARPRRPAAPTTSRRAGRSRSPVVDRLVGLARCPVEMRRIRRGCAPRTSTSSPATRQARGRDGLEARDPPRANARGRTRGERTQGGAG